MDNNELKIKMDQLGSLMKQKQKRQADFDLMNKELDESIDSLKFELKQEFLKAQTTEQTDVLKIVYREGAVRWDSKGLKEYSKVHPEIKVYQVKGDPTVAFMLLKEAQ